MLFSSLLNFVNQNTTGTYFFSESTSKPKFYSSTAKRKESEIPMPITLESVFNEHYRQQKLNDFCYVTPMVGAGVLGAVLFGMAQMPFDEAFKVKIKVQKYVKMSEMLKFMKKNVTPTFTNLNKQTMQSFGLVLALKSALKLGKKALKGDSVIKQEN